jgi:hypothetical protein
MGGMGCFGRNGWIRSLSEGRVWGELRGVVGGSAGCREVVC